MALVNTASGPLENNATEFSLSISDTAVHDLPDTDGDDSAGGDPIDARTAEFVAVYVSNNQDQPLEARLKRDPKQNSRFESDDEVAATVPAGETRVLIGNARAPHGFVRVTVQFDTAPSGTDNVAALFDLEA
jgi:hypothetical protein